MIRKTIIRLRNLRDALRNPDGAVMARELKKVVADQVMPTLGKGLSPVDKQRNLAKYKDPKKYPGDKKPSNKANLHLTGEMLSYYTSYQDKKSGARMGIDRMAPHDVKVRAEANNIGTKHVAARPFVPTKGEKFNRTVTRAIKNALAKTIFNRLRRGKK